MGGADRPPTIEGDWDRFYLEFPDVYDRFALHNSRGTALLRQMFSLDGAVIVDSGSGTGRSTFELAKFGRFVVGFEPWAPMRQFAVRKARATTIRNVAFVDGIAEAMPFRTQSVDALVSVFGWPFWFIEGGRLDLAEQSNRDADRIVKRGGPIIIIHGSPRNRRPELRQVAAPAADPEWNRLMTEEWGFAYDDILVQADYRSVQEAVETYGFIYGRAAIDYLVAHNVSSTPWMLRIFHRKAAGSS